MAGPTKLIDAKDALQTISFGLLSIRQTTQGIRKALGKEVRRDKKATQNKQGFLRRLFDNARKKDAEKLIEAKKPKSFLSTASANIMSAGSSFFERILKAAGIFLVGYLTAKLPIIIKKIQEVVDWVRNVAGFLKPFVDGVLSVSRTIANTVGEWITGIKKDNNWTKDGDAVEAKMKELNESVETLNKDWLTLQEKIKLDIEKAEKEGRESVEGLDQETQDTVEATDSRSSQIIDLQEKRDSGELNDEQYLIELDKIYNQTMDNEVSTMQNFDANKGDSNLLIAGLPVGEKLTKEQMKIIGISKGMSESNYMNLSPKVRAMYEEQLGNQELATTNSSTATNSDDTVIKDNAKEGNFREMKKEDWVAYRNKRAKTYNKSNNVDVKVKLINMINKANDNLGLPNIDVDPRNKKEFLAHKVPILTNDLKVDGILKSDANLKSGNGRTIEIPIDTKEIAINNGNNKTTVVNNGSGSGQVVVIAENPLKQLTKYNRHFT